MRTRTRWIHVGLAAALLAGTTSSMAVAASPTDAVHFVLPEDGATVDATGASVQIFGEQDARVEVTVRGEVVGTGTIPHGYDLLLDLSELPTGDQTLSVTQTVDGEVTNESIDVTVTQNTAGTPVPSSTTP